MSSTTFLHAVRSLRRGVVPLVESAWLLGIARNVCLKRWETPGGAGRSGSSRPAIRKSFSTRGSAAPEGRREELIGLDDALTRLPEQQRRAILLRDWRGLSYDEVAEPARRQPGRGRDADLPWPPDLAELLREEPQQTRRRLGSLGNLGSLVTAVKTAFTGAAAATKIAAAVTVLAVSGVSVAVGPSLVGGGSEQAAPSRNRSSRALRRLPAKAAVLPTRDVSVRPHRQPARPARGSAPRARRPCRSRLPVSGAGVPTPLQRHLCPQPRRASRPAAGTRPGSCPPCPRSLLLPRNRSRWRRSSKRCCRILRPPFRCPTRSARPSPAAVGTIAETLPTLPVDPAPVVPAALEAVPPLPPLWLVEPLGLAL